MKKALAFIPRLFTALVIAHGVFTGLIKKKGVFAATSKGWKSQETFAFFSPIREELIMLIALILAIISWVWARGTADIETRLWASILALQCIPYIASVACQIAAYLPERRVTGTPLERIEPELRASP